jgi:hypothetical protein
MNGIKRAVAYAARTLTFTGAWEFSLHCAGATGQG